MAKRKRLVLIVVVAAVATALVLGGLGAYYFLVLAPAKAAADDAASRVLGADDGGGGTGTVGAGSLRTIVSLPAGAHTTGTPPDERGHFRPPYGKYLEVVPAAATGGGLEITAATASAPTPDSLFTVVFRGPFTSAAPASGGPAGTLVEVRGLLRSVRTGAYLTVVAADSGGGTQLGTAPSGTAAESEFVLYVLREPVLSATADGTPAIAGGAAINLCVRAIKSGKYLSFGGPDRDYRVTASSSVAGPTETLVFEQQQPSTTTKTGIGVAGGGGGEGTESPGGPAASPADVFPTPIYVKIKMSYSKWVALPMPGRMQADDRWVALTPAGTVQADNASAGENETITLVYRSQKAALAGGGTRVALLSSSGKWVSMSGGCGKLWASTAGDRAPGVNQLFVLYDRGNSLYNLQSESCGKYVAFRSPTAITADGQAPSDSSYRFYMERIPGPDPVLPDWEPEWIPPPAVVGVRSPHGRYLSSDHGRMRADRQVIGQWELFTLKRITAAMNPGYGGDDKWALIDYNGRPVSSGPGGMMTAGRALPGVAWADYPTYWTQLGTGIGQNEIWTLVPLGGQYYVQNYNRLYMTFGTADSGWHVQATAGTATTEHERVTIVPAP